MEETMRRAVLLTITISALLTFTFTAQTQDTQREEIQRKDREYVLELYQEIYGPNGRDRAERVANMPKFVKMPSEKAIPDEWRVEFVYLVTSETGNFEKERDRILTLYGGELMDNKACYKRTCAFWIKTPESVAERISTDQMVRRVEQNGIGRAILNSTNPLPPPPRLSRRA